MDDNIGKFLGLSPIFENETNDEIVESTATVPAKLTDQSEDDYVYARTNFYEIIEQGTSALQELIEVAKQSQHPRAYEVIASTIKVLVDANKDLVDLSRKQKELSSTTNKTENNTVTNNLFVGSTADLQKMLKGINNE
jgi:hypothetical protein